MPTITNVKTKKAEKNLRCFVRKLQHRFIYYLCTSFIDETKLYIFFREGVRNYKVGKLTGGGSSNLSLTFECHDPIHVTIPYSS